MGMVADTVLSLAWGRISAWPGACAEGAQPGRGQALRVTPKGGRIRAETRAARKAARKAAHQAAHLGHAASHAASHAAGAHSRGLAAPMAVGPAILDPALGFAMLFRGGKA